MKVLNSVNDAEAGPANAQASISRRNGGTNLRTFMRTSRGCPPPTWVDALVGFPPGRCSLLDAPMQKHLSCQRCNALFVRVIVFRSTGANKPFVRMSDVVRAGCSLGCIFRPPFGANCMGAEVEEGPVGASHAANRGLLRIYTRSKLHPQVPVPTSNYSAKSALSTPAANGFGGIRRRPEATRTSRIGVRNPDKICPQQVCPLSGQLREGRTCSRLAGALSFRGCRAS